MAEKALQLIMHKIEPEESYTAGDGYPLLPEGKYIVQCIKTEKAYSHHKALKLFLKFKVVDGPFTGEDLFMAMNMVDSRTGKPFTRVPRGSKYFHNWVIANNSILPSRSDRMCSRKFKDGIFEAVVRTVKPVFSDGTPRPECFHYSIVDYLKKRLQ